MDPGFDAAHRPGVTEAIGARVFETARSPDRRMVSSHRAASEITEPRDKPDFSKSHAFRAAANAKRAGEAFPGATLRP